MESRPDQCCVCVPSTCMSVCVWSLVWTDVCIIYTYVDDNCMPCNPCYHVVVYKQCLQFSTQNCDLTCMYCTQYWYSTLMKCCNIILCHCFCLAYVHTDSHRVCD